MSKKVHASEKDTVSLKNTISRILEMPEYSIGTGMHIEINSNHEAVVENCRGILEYTSETVRLIVPGVTVRFNGKALSIGSMNKNSTVVSGKIESIEFSSLE